MTGLQVARPAWDQRTRTGVVCCVLACVAMATGLPTGLRVDHEILIHVRQRYGEEAVQRLLDWQRIMVDHREDSDAQKLQIVNDFFNSALAFKSDISHWFREDYWATPIESLVTGGGDCEDYAIAKYLTLRALGIADEKLKITYVQMDDEGQSLSHMVLAYYDRPRAVPLILDNLNPKILKATERRDLEPIYSFNGLGLWLGEHRGRVERIGETSQLNHWNDLQRRLQSSAWGGNRAVPIQRRGIPDAQESTQP